MPEIRNTTKLSFDDLNFSVKISYMSIKNDPYFWVQGDHSHKAYEIYINLSGDVSFMVKNKLYPIKRGSVIIARPGEFHHCIYNNLCHHKHFWILIYFKKGNELFEILQKKGKDSDNFIQLSEKKLHKAEELCNRLIQNKYNALNRTIDMLTLISILKENKQNEHMNLLSNYPEVSSAIKYMHDHFSENITITQIATYAHTSVSTLERSFKKVLGQTPNSYLKSLRMTCSIELLNEGKTVSQACFLSGFNDYSRYINQFKKIYGQTPKQYQLNMET